MREEFKSFVSYPVPNFDPNSPVVYQCEIFADVKTIVTWAGSPDDMAAIAISKSWEGRLVNTTITSGQKIVLEVGERCTVHRESDPFCLTVLRMVPESPEESPVVFKPEVTAINSTYHLVGGWGIGTDLFHSEATEWSVQQIQEEIIEPYTLNEEVWRGSEAAQMAINNAGALSLNVAHNAHIRARWASFKNSLENHFRVFHATGKYLYAGTSTGQLWRRNFSADEYYQTGAGEAELLPVGGYALWELVFEMGFNPYSIDGIPEPFIPGVLDYSWHFDKIIDIPDLENSDESSETIVAFLSYKDGNGNVHPDSYPHVFVLRDSTGEMRALPIKMPRPLLRPPLTYVFTDDGKIDLGAMYQEVDQLVRPNGEIIYDTFYISGEDESWEPDKYEPHEIYYRGTEVIGVRFNWGFTIADIPGQLFIWLSDGTLFDISINDTRFDFYANLSDGTKTKWVTNDLGVIFQSDAYVTTIWSDTLLYAQGPDTPLHSPYQSKVRHVAFHARGEEGVVQYDGSVNGPLFHSQKVMDLFHVPSHFSDPLLAMQTAYGHMFLGYPIHFKLVGGANPNRGWRLCYYPYRDSGGWYEKWPWAENEPWPDLPERLVFYDDPDLIEGQEPTIEDYETLKESGQLGDRFSTFNLPNYDSIKAWGVPVVQSYMFFRAIDLDPIRKWDQIPRLTSVATQTFEADVTEPDVDGDLSGTGGVVVTGWLNTGEAVCNPDGSWGRQFYTNEDIFGKGANAKVHCHGYYRHPPFTPQSKYTFVAIADNGIVGVTHDTRSWVSNDISDVLMGGSIRAITPIENADESITWIAVGTRGTILISSDALNWARIKSSSPAKTYNAAYFFYKRYEANNDVQVVRKELYLGSSNGMERIEIFHSAEGYVS